MAVSHTPGLALAKSGKAVGTALTRVYLVQSGTDPDTDGPVLVLDDTGPATHVFTHDEGNGLILVDDDPDDPDFPALKIALNASRELIFYT